MASAACAAPITYTLRGRASGSLDATGFADAAFTVTATADSATVRSLAPGVPCNDGRAATYTVSGIGSGVIVTPVSVADNAAWELIALSRGRCLDLGPMWLNGMHRQFQTYDLTGAVGPVPLESPSAPPGVAVQTSQGVLVFTRLNEVTFEARGGDARPVPAATGPGLAALALAVAAGGALAAGNRPSRPRGRARAPARIGA